LNFRPNFFQISGLRLHDKFYICLNATNMKLMKAIALATVIMLFSITGKAQDKYEYGQVSYSANLTTIKYVIATSVSGTFQVVDNGTLSDGYVTNNFVPVNKVLDDLATKGWEVYSTTTAGANNTSVFYYYIRRKKG
jgi:predicted secreted protein